MNGCPVLSLVTATPFVAACLIMLVGRTRPLGVRLIAVGAATVTLGLSLYLYLAYDLAAGGFQFREQYPLVRALGISVELGADGMSVLMVLLTAIIIFAGVFASWTVRVRDQEFYALLLTLVTGVFGVFVSLDLFVFFLFYEIAVLPMYLLIGIWGSTGEVRPQGIFAWAFRETGVGTKEYAAMKLTLYLLLGSAFILVGLFVLYFAGGVHSFSLLALSEVDVQPGDPALGVPRPLRGLRHPGGHLAAPHLVARRARVRPHRGLDAPRRRPDEARRLRRPPRGDDAPPRGRPRTGRPWWGRSR